MRTINFITKNYAETIALQYLIGELGYKHSDFILKTWNPDFVTIYKQRWEIKRKLTVCPKCKSPYWNILKKK